MLELRFPADFCPDKIEAFVKETIPALDCFTAFAGPGLFISFHGRDSDASYAKTQYVRLAARHPGLTITPPNYLKEAKSLGAHWLTYLSPKHIDSLGGQQKLKTMLPNSWLSEIGKGMMVQTGKVTDVGDLLAGDMLPDHRVLAETLAPITSQRLHGIDLWTAERDLLAELWRSRFLGDPADLTKLAGQLEHLTQLENAVQHAIDDPTLAHAASLAELLESELFLADLLPLCVAENLRNLMPQFVLKLFVIGQLDTRQGKNLIALYGAGRLLGSFRRSALSESGKQLELLDWFLVECGFPMGTAEEKKAFAKNIGLFGEKLIPTHPTSLDLIFDSIDEYDEVVSDFLNEVTSHLHTLLHRDVDQAEVLADQVVMHCHRYPDMALWLARIYCKRDRLEDALKLVEAAGKQGYSDMPKFQNYKELEPLWNKPRFKALFS